MKCPGCDREIIRMYGHLTQLKDELHKELYEQQMEIVLDLFYDLNFESTVNVNDFNCFFPYSSCLKIWQANYGKEKCKDRANKLNAKNVSKTMSGREFTEEHKKALSIARSKNEPWNKGLTVDSDERVRNIQDKRNESTGKVLKEMYEEGKIVAWATGLTKETDFRIRDLSEKTSRTMAGREQNNSWGIAGIRKDIGHHAASTYEANIYRILQYHNVNYLKEFDIIKELKKEDGTSKYYRIDIRDVEGFFGIKNAFLEVKGWMKEEDREKIRLFREQYPNEVLLTIGYGDKREKHYWEPDIDYAELTKKYKPLIPLWEDTKQNLRKNPELYKIESGVK